MKLTLYVENHEDIQAAKLLCRVIELWHNATVDIVDTETANIALKRDNTLGIEEFRIVCSEGHSEIYGGGTAGIAYAVSSLIKLFDGKKFSDAEISESPFMPFRGVHLYMPAKEDVEGFKRIIDMMALLKLNTLIIEVGGGMEYKRHPEINDGWERFCKNILSFPGGVSAFSSTDAYYKDSTHTELGGGTYLPQETVRGIVDYAKAYGIDVIPELQFLSHAYYITTVYPQYAERKDDHYPDTTCPLCEEAYQLYFELAEEVIDVFKPKIVAIGHDEIRVMKQNCPACEPYTGHELLAYDINRLHEFYAGHGIKISMWCEKLQQAENYYRSRRAKSEKEENRVQRDQFGREWYIPDTYDAIKMIPNDILLQDWLYGWSWESHIDAEKHGFKEVFGNFHGEYTRKWKQRTATEALIGGETSSWCQANEYTLGRDGIIGDIWYSALMLWDKNYDEDAHDKYLAQMHVELPKLREVLRGKQSASVSYVNNGYAKLIYASKDTSDYILSAGSLPESGIWAELRKTAPSKLFGATFGESKFNITLNEATGKLVFVHSCLGERNFQPSYDRPFTDWCPGVYVIRYADGVSKFINIRFGTDIGNYNMDFNRSLGYEGRTPEDNYSQGTTAEDCPDPPLYQINRHWKNSLMYSAQPIKAETGWAYVMEWENPRPQVAIERIFVVNTVNKVNEQAMLFCVAAVNEHDISHTC